MTIGVVTALGKVGINTASILTSLGVAGLTIGFAAKDALSNMISGLFMVYLPEKAMSPPCSVKGLVPG